MVEAPGSRCDVDTTQIKWLYSWQKLLAKEGSGRAGLQASV